jgi:hypothetical protein
MWGDVKGVLGNKFVGNIRYTLYSYLSLNLFKDFHYDCCSNKRKII